MAIKWSKSTCLLSIILLSLLTSLAYAQDKPKLMILASAHLDNPGNDNINMTVSDVFTDRRQLEIQELVDKLALFKPTHVGVEFTQPYQDAADMRFTGYQNGTYDLSRSEADQIGIRLAAQLGHETVYAIDWNGAAPGDPDLDYNWPRYARENGQEAALESIMDPERSIASLPELKDQSMIEWYRQVNAPEALRLSHEVYFDIAMIGGEENMIGATWVGSWYARNLKIFAHLRSLVSSKDDRIFIVFGQGHAYLLEQFARESGVFDVVSVNSILADTQ